MADDLTPEERAALAAYRGRVTVCEPGEMAGDGSLPMRAQIQQQWAEGKARRLMRPKLREAEAEAPDTRSTLSPDDASRILDGADNA